MAEKTGYVADFPSEIIKEGKIQVLVPNLKAYGVTPSDYAPIQSSSLLQSSHGVQP